MAQMRDGLAVRLARRPVGVPAAAGKNTAKLVTVSDTTEARLVNMH